MISDYLKGLVGEIVMNNIMIENEEEIKQIIKAGIKQLMKEEKEFAESEKEFLENREFQESENKFLECQEIQNDEIQKIIKKRGRPRKFENQTSKDRNKETMRELSKNGYFKEYYKRRTGEVICEYCNTKTNEFNKPQHQATKRCLKIQAELKAKQESKPELNPIEQLYPSNETAIIYEQNLIL